jgi:hypothetical protein
MLSRIIYAKKGGKSFLKCVTLIRLKKDISQVVGEPKTKLLKIKPIPGSGTEKSKSVFVSLSRIKYLQMTA